MHTKTLFSSTGKHTKTMFHFQNADASRSKCLIKAKMRVVNLNDGDNMHVPRDPVPVVKKSQNP